MRKHLRTRSAFTLVELLVACALSLVIMGIIAVAFQKSIDAFRTLRSVSQMQEKLKSVHMVLKRDLEADHFQPPAASDPNCWNTGPRLSDQRLDLNGKNPGGAGFFSIMQGPSTGGGPLAYDSLYPGTPYIYDGADSDGLPSPGAVTHSMHFTARLRPDQNVTTFSHEEDFFYANAPNSNPVGTPVATPVMATPAIIPGTPVRCPPDFARPNIFASQWAEIIYFLKPNGSSANGVQPLFTLYRRQRLLLDTTQASNQTGTSAPWNAAFEQSFPDISWQQKVPVASQRVNITTDIPVKSNRMPIGVVAADGVNTWRSATLGELAPAFTGDDILLADVLSFEIKANWSTGSASMPFEALNTAAAGNIDWPYDYLPAVAGAAAGSSVNPRYSTLAAKSVPVVYDNTTYPARTFDTWSIADGVTWAQIGTGPGPAFTPIYNNGVVWSANTVGGAGASAGFGYNDPSKNKPGLSRAPLRIRIMSLQIRVRVWDDAAKTARQMTIVQDMTRNNNN